MLTLTSLQRDFLDRFFVENQNLEPGYAFAVAREHGFTYEHFMQLWKAYVRSWGNDLSTWGQPYPPLSPPPNPPLFPWASIQELEEQLTAEASESTRAEDLAAV